MRHIRRALPAMAVMAGLVALVLTSTLGACSSFTADDSADGGDGGVAAGGASLAKNGDFELPACAQWINNGSSLAADSTARNGNGSCRVCFTTSPAVWTISQDVDRSTPAGTKLYAEAWVRTPSNGEAAVNVSVLASTSDVAGTQLDIDESKAGSIDQTWKRIDVVLVTTKPAAKLSMAVAARASMGCFLVDDVSLKILP